MYATANKKMLNMLILNILEQYSDAEHRWTQQEIGSLLKSSYDKYDDISHYRLDKMTEVETIDEKLKPQKEIKDFKEGFHLPKHMAEHIYMFSGPSVRVKLLAPTAMMDELIDWLGKEFKASEIEDKKQILVTLRCNEDSMFYWALQYGPYVEVLEPESLRTRLKKAIFEMNNKYKK